MCILLEKVNNLFLLKNLKYKFSWKSYSNRAENYYNYGRVYG